MSKQTGRKQTVHSQSFSDFMDQFVGESDRAAVILGAAKIDLLLYQILDKYMLPSASADDDLLGSDSPLGAFSARIKVCHRLGLIDTQFAKLLNTFRRLRNSFAHEITNGELSSGSARDRVASMAEPFMGLDFFDRLVERVAKLMKREERDPGVLFRSTLALFHIHLLAVYHDMEDRPNSPAADIVDFCRGSGAPSSAAPGAVPPSDG